VNLDRLVWVGSLPIIRNRLIRIVEMQLSEREFHQPYTPSHEHIRVSKRLLGILGCGSVDVEDSHVFLVLCLLGTFDGCHIPETPELGRIEDLILCGERVVGLPPFQGLDELCFGLGKVVQVGSEELLEDEEGGVWSRLPGVNSARDR